MIRWFTFVAFGLRRYQASENESNEFSCFSRDELWFVGAKSCIDEMGKGDVIKTSDQRHCHLFSCCM